MMTEPQQTDNRLFDRFSARFPAKIKDSRNDYGTGISLRDASAQGVRVTSNQQFYLNDSLIFDIKLPDSDMPLTLKGQVVWVKKGSMNVWDVGIKFHEIRLIHLSRLYHLIEPQMVSS
ncbi:hypothetical protein MNBD_BACTEROID05-1263 [hydrothermal vent metagenome]|uniref:PilZ domain-containing protein n=1 Tax=hydrothermal vent metagenome TaxID=652676 RepID=A0A3B0TEJ7_9ZZZZ